MSTAEARKRVRFGQMNRRIARMPQVGFRLLERGHIRHRHDDPPVTEGGFHSPEPATVNQIYLEISVGLRTSLGSRHTEPLIDILGV